MLWLRQNIAGIVQNWIAALVGAVVALAWGGMQEVLAPCPGNVQADIAKGEAAILRGEATLAAGIADDALASNHSCQCVFELKAVSHHLLRQRAIARGEDAAAEEHRISCYSAAVRSSRSVRMQTLAKACKATAPLDT